MKIKISRAPNLDFFFVDVDGKDIGWVTASKKFWYTGQLDPDTLYAIAVFLRQYWNPKDETTYEKEFKMSEPKPPRHPIAVIDQILAVVPNNHDFYQRLKSIRESASFRPPEMNSLTWEQITDAFHEIMLNEWQEKAVAILEDRA